MKGFPFVYPTPKIVLDYPNFRQIQVDLTESIKLMTWNVNKMNCTRKWQAEFTDLWEKYQPDFILLQEFYWIPDNQLSLCFRERGWEFAANLKFAKTEAYSGVLTASKVKPSSRTVLLTDRGEPITKTPKLSFITEYPIADCQQTLWIVNTHCINFVTTPIFKLQLNQLRIALSTHSGLLVIAGDFNTWNAQRMNVLKSMIADLNLNFVPFIPAEQAKIKRFLFSHPLDHICYSGLTLAVKRALVLSEFRSSDHVPLFVEFSHLRKASITQNITELSPD